jgi:hypothetical protein
MDGSQHSPRGAITIASYTRKIVLSTPLADDTSWILLLVPEGSTDQQVLEWSEDLLPPDAMAELRQRIEADASGGDAA